MALLKKIPFFLLLLVLFFCLHGWLQNYGFIGIQEVFYPGLVIIACIVLFTALLFIFTRNLLFASLVSFFISVWYLFFGALHDWVKNLPIPTILKSYSVWLPLLLLVTLGVIFLLQCHRSIHRKLAFYLNLLLFVYCLVDVVLLLKEQVKEDSKPVSKTIDFKPQSVVKKPNVYLLLFDGYSGYKSLKDTFGFTNNSLQQYFEKHAFTTLPVSSNYDLTYFSMSCLFNMNYVKDDFDNMNLTQRDFQKRGAEINRAAIFPVFRSMGYAIKNLSIFEIDDQPPVSGKNSFLLAHSNLITDKILHKRMNRDIGDRLSSVIPFWKNSDFYQHDKDNKLTEELLLKDVVQKKDKPQFTYAHFMMPHGPYYYDSLGNQNPYDSISHYTMWQNKALFTGYVQYVNSRIYNMVDTITRHDPGALILVMGDHGFRTYRGKQLYQPSRYDNLCAVRFSGDEQTAATPISSTVNLFRYVLNKAFGQNLPYLKDSAVLLRY